jgi:hypothetical protein
MKVIDFYYCVHKWSSGHKLCIHNLHYKVSLSVHAKLFMTFLEYYIYKGRDWEFVCNVVCSQRIKCVIE